MLIVECWNGDFKSKERRDFKCHIDVWDALLELGRQYGWKPLGTIPAEMSYTNWIKSGNFTNDYDPIDYGYVKTFQSVDAQNLANSLKVIFQKMTQSEIKIMNDTKPGPPIISENMTAEDMKITNRGLSPALLEKFISFLQKGEFDYTFDD